MDSYFIDARSVEDLKKEHCGNWYGCSFRYHVVHYHVMISALRYWFGRYLYEAVEYFGEKLSANSDSNNRIFMPATVVHEFDEVCVVPKPPPTKFH